MDMFAFTFNGIRITYVHTLPSSSEMIQIISVILYQKNATLILLFDFLFIDRGFKYASRL